MQFSPDDFTIEALSEVAGRVMRNCDTSTRDLYHYLSSSNIEGQLVEMSSTLKLRVLDILNSFKLRAKARDPEAQTRVDKKITQIRARIEGKEIPIDDRTLVYDEYNDYDYFYYDYDDDEDFDEDYAHRGELVRLARPGEVTPLRVQQLKRPRNLLIEEFEEYRQPIPMMPMSQVRQSQMPTYNMPVSQPSASIAQIYQGTDPRDERFRQTSIFQPTMSVNPLFRESQMRASIYSQGQQPTNSLAQVLQTTEPEGSRILNQSILGGGLQSHPPGNIRLSELPQTISQVYPGQQQQGYRKNLDTSIDQFRNSLLQSRPPRENLLADSISPRNTMESFTSPRTELREMVMQTETQARSIPHLSSPTNALGQTHTQSIHIPSTTNLNEQEFRRTQESVQSQPIKLNISESGTQTSLHSSSTFQMKSREEILSNYMKKKAMPIIPKITPIAPLTQDYFNRQVLRSRPVDHRGTIDEFSRRMPIYHSISTIHPDRSSQARYSHPTELHTETQQEISRVDIGRMGGESIQGHHHLHDYDDRRTQEQFQSHIERYGSEEKRSNLPPPNIKLPTQSYSSGKKFLNASRRKSENLEMIHPEIRLDRSRLSQSMVLDRPATTANEVVVYPKELLSNRSRDFILTQKVIETSPRNKLLQQSQFSHVSTEASDRRSMTDRESRNIDDINRLLAHAKTMYAQPYLTQESQQFYSHPQESLQQRYGQENQPRLAQESQMQYERKNQTQFGGENQYARESQQFGREIQSQYGRESQTQYGQNQYNRDAQTQLGRESQTQYGRDSQNQFNRDAQTQFGRESQTQYGREDLNQFGRESQTQYGRENQNLYGRETQTQYGSQFGREGQSQFGREIQNFDNQAGSQFMQNQKPMYDRGTDVLGTSKLAAPVNIPEIQNALRDNIRSSIGRQAENVRQSWGNYGSTGGSYQSDPRLGQSYDQGGYNIKRQVPIFQQ